MSDSQTLEGAEAPVIIEMSMEQINAMFAAQAEAVAQSEAEAAARTEQALLDSEAIAKAVAEQQAIIDARYANVLAANNEALARIAEEEAAHAERLALIKTANEEESQRLAEHAKQLEALEAENQRLHEEEVARQEAANKLVHCGVFKDGKLIRTCHVPEHMVELQAHKESGEEIRRGEFKFLNEEPVPNYTAQRKDMYLPLEAFADAYYHLKVNGDDSKMTEWLEHTKTVKELIPKVSIDAEVRPLYVEVVAEAEKPTEV